MNTDELKKFAFDRAKSARVTDDTISEYFCKASDEREAIFRRNLSQVLAHFEKYETDILKALIVINNNEKLKASEFIQFLSFSTKKCLELKLI